MITRRHFAAFAAAATTVRSAHRPMFTLESEEAVVSFDLLGGGLVDFRLRAVDLNPFTWEEPGGELDARPRGHFLCCDRWGAASAAEQKAGMPFHGEAPRVEWKRVSANRMAAELPRAGLTIERDVRLFSSQLRVTERVTNRLALGRVYNFVQHPTISPPFLTSRVFVDANAGLGFSQSDPGQKPLAWPQAEGQGVRANLREFVSDQRPNVVSYVVPDAMGWVTAVNPDAGLLLGYLWKSADYPWLNIWRNAKDGKPDARGLEFGTCGWQRPFSELTRRARMLDTPLYSYLDAGATHERTYWVILRQVWKGARRVAGLRQDGFEVTATVE
jgi:hypothetical protein